MPRESYRLHRPVYYRSVFLSDFHMGAKSFDAAAVLDFLHSVECKYLFLVGDIIDGWKLNKRWHWTENCSRIFDELARKAAKGTKIIYLPGNHDDEVRHIMPLTRRGFAKKLGIKITDKTVHTLADGRQFLVLHGDQFDRRILRGPLSRWSDRLYDRIMDLVDGHHPARIKIDGQIKRFSLAKTLSRHGGWALYLLNNFESAVYKMAERRDVDGLICGHTHIPVIKSIRNITYANCGSWVRTGHTALVEHHDGELELLDWPDSGAHYSYEQTNLFGPAFEQRMKPCKIVPDSSRYRTITEMVIRKIRHTWPVKGPAPESNPHWVEISSHNVLRIKRVSGFVAQDIVRDAHDSLSQTTRICIRPPVLPVTPLTIHNIMLQLERINSIALR